MTIERYSAPITIILLLAVLVAGGYIRMIPAIKYGLELDEADPWEMYWIAQQLYEKGLFNFEPISRSELFWYPTGRDLLRQEYIGTAWVAALTYHVAKYTGLSLREWIALFPAIAGVLTALIAFIFVRVATGSNVGGLVAASLFALMPGAISRSTVGFVEKMVIASVLILLSYLFLYLALRRGELRSAAIAGLLAGLSSFFWGGYHFISISIALVILLDPVIFGRPSEQRLKIYAIVAGLLILVSSAYPGISARYYITGLGLAVTASVLLYSIIISWDALGLSRRLFAFDRALYAWVLAFAAILGIAFILTETISVPGRLLLAIGIRQFSPLAESVSEHASMPLQQLAREIGVPLGVAAFGALYYAYRHLYAGRREEGDQVIWSLFAMSFLTAFAAYNMAYFVQMASFYSAIAAGIAVGAWMSGEKITSLRKGLPTIDEIRFFISMLLLFLVATGAASGAISSYETNSIRAPMILTSGLSPYYERGGNVVVPINDAWQRALEYLKMNTSKDALVVSWWDYGYWISVGAGRATVADGSTWNETQIRILARILTGNENEASALLYLLGAKPNNTYIVFYDSYAFIREQNSSMALAFPLPSSQRYSSQFYVIHGSADLPKSFQMLKIGYRIDPFVETPLLTRYSSQTSSSAGRAYHFPGFVGTPESNVRTVSSALLYGLSMDALTRIPANGLVRGCNALSNVTIVIPSAYDPASGQLLFAQPMIPERFSPEAIIVSCFSTEDLGQAVQQLAVVVSIYRWLG